MDSNKYLMIGAIVLLLVVALFFAARGGNLFQTSTPAPAPTEQVPVQTEEATDAGSLQSPESTSLAQVKTITLTPLNNSGQSGVATLTEENGKVVVALALTGGNFTSPQPAHIHTGKCPELGAIKYPLTNIVNGKSSTTLNVDMKTLLSGLPLGINVHKSPSETKVYTSCGDL